MDQKKSCFFGVIDIYQYLLIFINTHKRLEIHLYIYIYIYIYIYKVSEAEFFVELWLLGNGPTKESSNPVQDCISQ